MNITRHIGRLNNSGTRIVVVFRKLEDEPESCLVVREEFIPDLFREDLMKIVNGPQCQAATELAEPLSTMKLKDGSFALQSLHERRYLTKVAISQVDMLPVKNNPVSLAQINEAIDGESAVTDDAAVAKAVAAVKAPAGATDESKAQALNDAAAIIDETIAMKKAELAGLEEAAAEKRAEAAKLVKTQKKNSKDKRVKTPEEKQATLDARNERRRASYDTTKEADIDSSIDQQINDKILRDAELT